ncbi:hypothetical protein [Palleronia sp. LCG004]|uniref:hypothetical protein n=1 Tax=Palleronia sp. LCG004 TaxID=3079304 RepID=UPI002942032B|nr:hypothetical protein [Palleronia sp. LCG004]WOI56566.1 hypothetical protein RVY76_01850 [Palleronia sp. LCG004]
MIDISKAAGRIDVTAGRVTTFDLGGSVSAVTAQPESGNVTINPDGTLSLVLADKDFRGHTDFSVTLGEGADAEQVDVLIRAKAGPQANGWGEGDHYMLAVDDEDDVVVEPGENHRKIYVSESDDALSRSDIAAREGISEGDINAKWLEAHPEYGASEDMALKTDLGMSLWYSTTDKRADPTSNWLLFERGYEYDDTGRLIGRDSDGESDIHPLYVGAWGEGEKPVLGDRVHIWQDPSQNVVVQGLEIDGARVMKGGNLLFDDVTFDGSQVTIQGLFGAIDGATLHGTTIIDATNGGRTSGFYGENIDGLLIDKVFADRNGWSPGYETGDGDAPRMQNHNIYIQTGVEDVTFRDSISMRGSSFGAQFRSGAVIEGSAFVDNNVAFNTSGGQYDNRGHNDNYSLVLDNIVTSAGNKPGAGARDWGIEDYARWTSYVGNIIAHMADPADPEDRASKTDGRHDPHTIRYDDAFADDTLIYNWISDRFRDSPRHDHDQNLPDIDPAELDEVTIRRFVENELGVSNPDDPIDILATFLRANWGQIEASDVVDFFQKGFGKDVSVIDGPQDLRFVPDERGEGFRWDNRLNWTSEELPQSGDSVDLAGNWVTYAGTNRLQSLDLGDGGRLTVRQGLLEVADLEGGVNSAIEIGRAGQLWTDGYDGEKRIDVSQDGGRFANFGTVEGGLDLAVSSGEAILATGGAKFEVDGGLQITGDRAKIGFDGQGGGVASLSLADGAVLQFEAARSGFSTIAEFRSGHWGTRASDVVSSVDLGSADTWLVVDFADLRSSGRFDLVEVDELVGGFGTIEVDGASGISVWIDYAEDRLQVAKGGNTLTLVGSDASDVFVAADGIEVRIEEYSSNDRLDLTAVMDGRDLSDLRLAQSDGETAIVDAAGDAIATFGDAVGTVHLVDDGTRVTLKGDTNSGPIDPKPEPQPEPEQPEPEPEPEKPEPQPEPEKPEPQPEPEKPEPQPEPEKPEPQPEPEKPQPQPEPEMPDQGDGGPIDWNVIEGSSRPYQNLAGTDGSDAIRANGGRLNQITGGDGADAFIFGSRVADNVQTMSVVNDFDVSEDMVVIEQGAQIVSQRMHGDTMWIGLKGDSDMIALQGDDLSVDTVKIVHDDAHWIG